jgi:hypothetical protein
MSRFEAHERTGSLAWIEWEKQRGGDALAFLVALVQAAYMTWRESHWIIRRAFCHQFPRKSYLDGLGVPYAKAEFEHSVFRVLSWKRRVLSLVFDTPEECLESLEDDRPDERYLVLEAFPKRNYPNAEDVLAAKLEDAVMSSMKSVTRGDCSGAVVCDPNEGIARVFSSDDAAVRFRRAFESLQGD